MSENTNKPWLFAGPCSAESREQVLDTAQALMDLENLKIFRASLWKPRTQAGHFEGVGEQGLDWLCEVKQRFNIPVATEVGNPKHAELALKKGIDVLWIGARTTVNPFYVQEIAEALRGSQAQIWVKNPVHPDLSLWIGAINRMEQMGLKNIGAIHRGFFQYMENRYRNAPEWQIPLELMRHIPTLNMVCDISHIAGKRDLLEEVAQKATRLQFKGLMIETHLNPDKALSDAAQQITPENLKKWIKNLHTYQENNGEAHKELHALRKEIDKLDLQLWQVLSERMIMAKKIGALKKEQNLSIFQKNRWQEVMENYMKIAQHYHISQTFAEKLANAIHQYAIACQDDLMHKKEDV